MEPSTGGLREAVSARLPACLRRQCLSQAHFGATAFAASESAPGGNRICTLAPNERSRGSHACRARRERDWATEWAPTPAARRVRRATAPVKGETVTRGGMAVSLKLTPRLMPPGAEGELDEGALVGAGAGAPELRPRRVRDPGRHESTPSSSSSETRPIRPLRSPRPAARAAPAVWAAPERAARAPPRRRGSPRAARAARSGGGCRSARG
jgi:hypothetical protein